MKLWIDDVRPAPDGYVWAKSVNEAKNTIANANARFSRLYKEENIIDETLHITLIDLDDDAGEYASDGGDYIEFLNWLEWLYDGKGTYTEFHIHSMNPIGVANMRRIIERNGWKEIK